MILSEQILSSLFCIGYGFIYLLIFYFFRKKLIYGKYNLYLNFVYSIIMGITFFILLLYINNGILSFYYIVFILLGFSLCYFVVKK